VDPTTLGRKPVLPHAVRTRLNGSAWALVLLVTIELATNFLSDDVRTSGLIGGGQTLPYRPLADAVWLGMMVTLLLGTTTLWLANQVERLSKALFLCAGVFTAQLLVATALVVLRLVQGWKVAVATLILDALIIFVTNVLVFALWYWLLEDPRATAETAETRWHLLFPQRQANFAGYAGWSPHFLDYLFVAYTTSVAFSPTDTLPLSRAAKLLMMTQSIIALITITVVAGTAINLLANNA